MNRSDPSGKWPEWLDNTINKAMKSIEDWLSMRSGTITEGISFSFSPGQYSMGYQLGSSIDTYGNYSLQFSEVSGYASSAGASVTMFVSATNAKNTDDLEQDATQIGANLGIPVEGIPVCAGADYATIPNKDDATQPYHGISFNAGLGTPGVEIHDENCYTYTIFSFNFFDLFGIQVGRETSPLPQRHGG